MLININVQRSVIIDWLAGLGGNQALDGGRVVGKARGVGRNRGNAGAGGGRSGILNVEDWAWWGRVLIGDADGRAAAKQRQDEYKHKNRGNAESFSHF